MLFKPNPNLARELEASPAFGARLAVSAEDGADEVRTLAHRIMPSGYGEQVKVVRSEGKVFIGNFNHGAHLDEYGSVNNPPFAPLRRGVRAAGLELVEE